MRIFISHSQEDQPLRSMLCKLFQKHEIPYWAEDELLAGQGLPRQLREAIKTSEACVFLATPKSLDSSWCRAELGAFWGSGKTVIVYMADNGVQHTDLPPDLQQAFSTSDADQLIESIKHSLSRPAGMNAVNPGIRSQIIRYYLRGLKETYYRHLRDFKWQHQVKVRCNIMTPMKSADGKNESLKIAHVDYPQDFTQEELKEDWNKGEGKCGVSWKTGEQELYAADIDSDATRLEEMETESETARSLRSVLSTPILYHDEPLGILNVDSLQGCDFTLLHKDYMSMVCRDAARDLSRLLREVLKRP